MFCIETVSGQGDPLSAVLYLISTEPCNRTLVKQCQKLLFQSNLGIKLGIELYAADKKTPLQLQKQNYTQILHQIYEKYPQVSGLKINYKKIQYVMY